MTLQEAKELAQQGIKVTHNYFTEDEYVTMRGNIVKFEDGVEIYFDEWTKGKDYLLDGWSKYPDEDNINDAHLDALESLSPE